MPFLGKRGRRASDNGLYVVYDPRLLHEGYTEAVDRASQRAWMTQWRRAAVALEEQHKRELRAMSTEDALVASDALLSLALILPLDPSRLADSGLVRQQAIFHRRPQ